MADESDCENRVGICPLFSGTKGRTTRSRKGKSRRILSEHFSPFESKVVQCTNARNTLEHNCARLAVAHLGPLKRRSGSASSATRKVEAACRNGAARPHPWNRRCLLQIR